MSTNEKKGIKRKVVDPEAPDLPEKRSKHVENKEEEMKGRKKKNFTTACELISYRDYFNYYSRFLLFCLPSCMSLLCKHHGRHSVSGTL